MLVCRCPTAGNLWVVSWRIGRGTSRCICRCRVRVLTLARRRRMVHFLLHHFSVDIAHRNLRGNTYLFLLFFGYRRGIGQLSNLLPLLVRLEPLADRSEQTDKGVCHSALQILRMNITFLERFLKRIVRGEVHWTAVLLVPRYAEYRARRCTLGHKRFLLPRTLLRTAAVGAISVCCLNR